MHHGCKEPAEEEKLGLGLRVSGLRLSLNTDPMLGFRASDLRNPKP